MKSFLLLNLLGVPLTLLFYLYLAVPGERATALVARSVRTLFASPAGRRILALASVVLGLGAVEASVDEAISARLGYDFTPLFSQIEGGLVEWFQGHIPPGMDLVLGWTYLAGYIALLILPAVVFTHTGSRRAIAGYIGSLGANYAFALPFYLFFPVAEVSWSGLSETYHGLEELWPGLTAPLRGMSALDNCFPSLHVSCATTALCFAWWYGSRRLALLTGGVWALVVWSVLALAIHWGLDVLAGIPFGIGCAVWGRRAAGPVCERLLGEGFLDRDPGPSSG